MHLIVERLDTSVMDERPTEIVERKGLGHPDSICDALAERLSVSLSRFYRDRFGEVFHHNVDKVLLRGGSSRPAFGGGEILEPVEIYLAGRAVREFKGVTVPVDELAIEGTREWLREHLRILDVDRHVVVHSLVRPGSSDLVELFRRQKNTGVWLANDTSCGVGYAPLSELEGIVYEVERELNSAALKGRCPAVGEDVKVMGVRRDNEIQLTVACAFVDRFVTDMNDYSASKRRVAETARAVAQRLTKRNVAIEVNTADGTSAGSVYITVSGTSAEAGDDGEAGRGNRVNGLITPCRPMTMESVAGKNPVTHVGKLYNVAAGLVATDLVEHVAGITTAECYLVSRIGRPLNEPSTLR